MAGDNPAGANQRVPPPQQQQQQHQDGAQGGQADGGQQPPDWMQAFALLQQQLQQQQQADIMAMQQQQQADFAAFQQAVMAAINPQPQPQPQPQQQLPQQVQGPALQAGAPVFAPAQVAAAPAVAGAAPPIPVGPAFDLVGRTFFKDAVDDDGCNPVTMAIDNEVRARTAIHTALVNPTARDFRDALISFDHLDAMKVYDMNSGPRDFDLWKDAWRDQVTKAATGIHPSAIQRRCFMEMKKALSVNTWHWIQNHPTLDGHKEDPDAILRALQDHAHDNANVAAMLMKATKMRAGEGSNHHEVDNVLGSIVRYFDKACGGNILDGIYKWLILIVYGDTEKLRLRLTAKWDKVADHHELFRHVLDFFDVNRKSSGLHSNTGEAYAFSGSTGNNANQKKNWKKKGRGNSQSRGRSPTTRTGPNSSQNNAGQNNTGQNRSRSQSAPRQGGQGGVCYTCGGPRHPKDQCPAKGKTCGRCKKPGHLSDVCQAPPPVLNASEAKPKPKPSTTLQANATEMVATPTLVMSQAVAPPPSCLQPATPALKPLQIFGISESNAVELDVLNVESIDFDNYLEPLERLDICLSDRDGRSVTVNGLPDTGSNINLLPDVVARKFNRYRPACLPDGQQPKTVDGKIEILAIVQTDILVNGILVPDVLWCSADTDKVLISQKVCRQVGLIPEGFPFTDCRKLALTYSTETKLAAEGFDLLPDLSKNAKTVKLSFPKASNLEPVALKFPNLFDGHIGRVAGPPARIELRQDAVPTSSGAHRRVAKAYLQPLKDEIQEQIDAGILEPVKETPEANYWLHPIVVVPKKGTSKVRLCVDFRRLNQFCIRPCNPEGTPWEKIRSLPCGKRWYAVFDANKGYHQVPLDDDSKKLTTFFTPHGKFRYLSLPMGYAGSQDIFTQRFGSAVDAFVDARATEDCLIAADSEEELLYKVEKFFEACQASGITLNTKKTQSGNAVIFAGYLIDERGATLDPALYKAIADFPTPKTLTELGSFLGLAQQQAHFTDTIAELTKPFHPLLKRKNDWIWTQEMSEAFTKTKSFLSTPAALAFYDHRRETRLFTDASRLNGLGFVLKQKQPDGYWKTVMAGSRYLTGAEERYAMVELELLAIAWACKKTATFTEGIEFTIVTDHKPLIPILRDYLLYKITPTFEPLWDSTFFLFSNQNHTL